MFGARRFGAAVSRVLTGLIPVTLWPTLSVQLAAAAQLYWLGIHRSKLISRRVR